MKPKELVGKAAYGFKFKSTNLCSFVDPMSDYIGKEGIIEHYHKNNNTVMICFEDNTWCYPYPEILNHLTEEANGELLQKEKEKLEELERQIIISKSEISRLEELVKYENQPKVGDIVKAWNAIGGGFIIGKLKDIATHHHIYNVCEGEYRHCEKITDPEILKYFNK